MGHEADQECVELYLHYPIQLQGMVLRQIPKITLPFISTLNNVQNIWKTPECAIRMKFHPVHLVLVS